MTTYQSTLTGLAPTDFQGFFENWPTKPSAASLWRLLQQAPHCAVAISNNEVIGFSYAISDGLLAAYVPLLEVKATHRGRGVGAQLIKHLRAELDRYYMVDICCDEEVVPFYEKLGFTRVSGMIARNREALVPLAAP